VIVPVLIARPWRLLAVPVLPLIAVLVVTYLGLLGLVVALLEDEQERDGSDD